MFRESMIIHHRCGIIFSNFSILHFLPCRESDIIKEIAQRASLRDSASVACREDRGGKPEVANRPRYKRNLTMRPMRVFPTLAHVYSFSFLCPPLHALSDPEPLSSSTLFCAKADLVLSGSFHLQRHRRRDLPFFSQEKAAGNK